MDLPLQLSLEAGPWLMEPYTGREPEMPGRSHVPGIALSWCMKAWTPCLEVRPTLRCNSQSRAPQRIMPTLGTLSEITSMLILFPFPVLPASLLVSPGNTS